MSLYDPFHARDTFDTGSGTAGIYRLSRLEDAGLTSIARLPFSIRVLLEAVLRNCDGYEVTEHDVKNLAGWNATAPAGDRSPLQAGPGGAARLHRRALRRRSGGHARAPCSGWAAIRSGSTRWCRSTW